VQDVVEVTNSTSSAPFLGVHTEAAAPAKAFHAYAPTANGSAAVSLLAALPPLKMEKKPCLLGVAGAVTMVVAVELAMAAAASWSCASLLATSKAFVTVVKSTDRTVVAEKPPVVDGAGDCQTFDLRGIRTAAATTAARASTIPITAARRHRRVGHRSPGGSCCDSRAVERRAVDVDPDAALADPIIKTL